MMMAGRAGATVVQVEVRNTVTVLDRIYGKALQTTLAKELMDTLRDLEELKPWDFDGTTNPYRLVLLIDESVPGDPPAIDLFLYIYQNQKKDLISKVPWRELEEKEKEKGKKKWFGTLEDTTTEIMSALNPLLFEQSKTLQSAFQRKVPVGNGGEVLNETSIVLALAENRHKNLGRSDFLLHCPRQKNTQLYCKAERFVKWRSISSLSVIPRCLEDDDKGRHPVRPGNSNRILDLEPEDIYLYTFVRAGVDEYSIFRSADCP